MSLARTPPVTSKRKLENDFNEESAKGEEAEESAKKLSLSYRSDSDPVNQSSLRFGKSITSI